MPRNPPGEHPRQGETGLLRQIKPFRVGFECIEHLQARAGFTPEFQQGTKASGEHSRRTGIEPQALLDRVTLQRQQSDRRPLPDPTPLRSQSRCLQRCEAHHHASGDQRWRLGRTALVQQRMQGDRGGGGQQKKKQPRHQADSQPTERGRLEICGQQMNGGLWIAGHQQGQAWSLQRNQPDQPGRHTITAREPERLRAENSLADYIKAVFVVMLWAPPRRGREEHLNFRCGNTKSSTSM